MGEGGKYGVPRLMTPPPISLLHNHVIPLITSLHKQQQESGGQEEDNIHDPKSKARLEHRARLVHIQREWIITAEPIIVERDRERSVVGKGGAVGFGNRPEFVHGCYQRAYEAEIDKGDEEGGAAR